jgi:stage IV sporulation protein FB
VSDPRGIHLGSVGGTSIEVQPSFLLLVAFFVILDLDQKLGFQYALLWIPTLLISVLFHEMAHAATIAMLGFGPSRIWLTGMGGVTLNERRARPWQDTLISIAGPLSSFLLAGGCALGYHLAEAARSDPMLKALVPRLVTANLAWGAFNLCPIYPLDGGQTARNLLRIFLSERLAFVISVWSSMILAVAIGVIALMWRWFFAAIVVGMMISQNWQQWRLYRSFQRPK